MAKTHSVTAMSFKSQRVEISPNFRGNVWRFAVESPAISAASLQSSRIVESVVARKNGMLMVVFNQSTLDRPACERY